MNGQARQDVTAGAAPPIRQFALFDRKGNMTGTLGKPGPYNQPVFSPDGKRIAVVLAGDIWVFDIAKGTGTQITSTPAQEASPVWSHDGKHLAYASNRGGAVGVYRKASNGTGKEEQLYVSDSGGLTHWSKDGRFILSFAGGAQTPTKADLFLLPVTGERKPITLLNTPANELGGRFSPDGHFVAYRSDESGSDEIYVRRFNAPGRGTPSLGADKWKVSGNGGLLVRWRNDGKEIYYLATNGDMMAASITTKPSFKVEPARVLFRVVSNFPVAGLPGGLLDISGDGTRFALLLLAAQ
jgi:Tol biopolymer transport system component